MKNANSIKRYDRLTPQVYFIRLAGTNVFKVGVSKNVPKRLTTLQSSNPYELELVAILKPFDIIAKEVETAFHQILKYHNCHIRGEWFELNEKVISRLLFYCEKRKAEFYRLESCFRHLAAQTLGVKMYKNKE